MSKRHRINWPPLIDASLACCSLHPLGRSLARGDLDEDVQAEHDRIDAMDTREVERSDDLIVVRDIYKEFPKFGCGGSKTKVAVDGTLTKKSGKLFWVGIFLDFVWLTTRTPHGAYARGARRNRIDRHGGEIERLALQASAWASTAPSASGSWASTGRGRRRRSGC